MPIPPADWPVPLTRRAVAAIADVNLLELVHPVQNRLWNVVEHIARFRLERLNSLRTDLAERSLPSKSQV